MPTIAYKFEDYKEEWRNNSKKMFSSGDYGGGMPFEFGDEADCRVEVSVRWGERAHA